MFIVVRGLVKSAKKSSEEIKDRQQAQSAALKKSQNYGNSPKTSAFAKKDYLYGSNGNHSAKPKAAKYSADDLFEGKSKSGVKNSAKSGTSIRDDRSNDWLAKQMREERQALYRMAYMFGFKPGTSTIKAAAENRDFHSKNCSSEGVDTAKGK